MGLPQLLWALLLLAAAAIYPSHAKAQTSATTAAYDRFMATATGAAQTTVTYGSNGTPVAAPSSMTLTPDASAGGGVTTSQSGTVRNPAGNPQAVTATGRIPPARAAAVIGKAILRGFMIYSVGEAMYDLAKEMRYTPRPDDEGGWSKTSPTGGLIHYSGANCIPMGAFTGEECADKLETAAFGADLNRLRPEYKVGGEFGCMQPPGRWCLTIVNYSTPSMPQTYAQYSEGVGEVAVSNEDFVNDIASKSGWPSTSNIARATAAAATSLGAEGALAPTVTTVTGPSQTQGRKATRSSTNPDGSTRTETEDCKWDHTYSGAVITSKETCTTTVTNDGVSGKTTTKTETKEGETPQQTEPEPDYQAQDTVLPELPKLYERKYPDGMAGVWTTQKAALLATPLGQLSTQLMPEIPSGGSCPSWPIPLDLGAWDFGTHDVAPPCWIWDFAKAVVVISALLLARALIFGG